MAFPNGGDENLNQGAHGEADKEAGLATELGHKAGKGGGQHLLVHLHLEVEEMDRR